MGRGISRDRLSDDLAEYVRGAVRKARKLKRVTNAQISVHLGWGEDPRRVVDMLSAPRPMRKMNALALVMGLCEMLPRNALADKVLRKAMELLGPFWGPPVLIPPWTFNELANHLADELSRKPGVGVKRRKQFARDVRFAIKQGALGMAESFYNACWTRSRGSAMAGEVLTLFGYAFTEREVAPDARDARSSQSPFRPPLVISIPRRKPL